MWEELYYERQGPSRLTYIHTHTTRRKQRQGFLCSREEHLTNTIKNSLRKTRASMKQENSVKVRKQTNKKTLEMKKSVTGRGKVVAEK